MNEPEKNKRVAETLRHIAGAINSTIKSEFGEMGFALLVFHFNAPGISHYISNARREDMIEAMREAADRIESKKDIRAKTDVSE